jgi:DNA-binding PadR family transcriptional regulator
MERELLLLGLLRMHDMHGYQINEFMDAHLGTSVQLKKPTVYKLLGNMVKEGWITYQEEREGNYPTRRVYQITPEGEETFTRLLRESLAGYSPVSHLSSIGFMYLDALPSEEVVPLLTQRREEVASLAEQIDAHTDHHGGFQTMLSYQRHHLRAELDWIDGLISHFEKA